MPMIEFPAERDVLPGHVVVRCRHIPCLKRIARVLSEVRRSSRSRGAVDRRQKNEIPARVVDLATAQGEAVAVVLEPPAVVEHESKKALFISNDLTGGILHVRGAVDPTSALAARIGGETKRHLVEKALGMIVVLHLNAIVGVISRPIGDAQSIRAQSVIVAEHGNPTVRPIEYLAPKSQTVVVARIRLPAVDDPRLDFQLLGGKYLNAHAGEKPRGIGRDIRRLIGPVIEVVKAEQTDVRQEDAGVDVNSVQRVNVISAVGLIHIPIRIVELPLAARIAGIIARSGGRILTDLAQHPRTNMVVVKISADTQMGKRNLV